MTRFVQDMAEYYGTTQTLAKTRLLDMGYSEVRGVLQSANGELIPAFCASCGAPYKRRTLPHKRVEGETVYHKVWNCRERQKGPKGNGCRNNFIREEELLRKVSDQLGWEWKGADDFDAEQFNALVQAVYVENGEVSVRRLARRVSA